MWTKLAHFVIKFRLFLIIILGVITAFMGYSAYDNVHISYEFAKAVPVDDPEMIYYQEFKKTFGQDDNVLVIGTDDSTLFTPKTFTYFKWMIDDLQRINGVETVISVSNLERLVYNKKDKRFVRDTIFKEIPTDKKSFDSLLTLVKNQKLYSQQLFSKDYSASLAMIFLNKKIFQSDKRDQLMHDILDATSAFEDYTHVSLRYAGLPFIRSTVMNKVKKELRLFLVLSIVVTAIILLLFFRSWSAMVFPMIVIGIVVIWSLGTLALLNYEITILTGLIPPIIVVIGIPNSIYLLNKYHQECQHHGNKMKALSKVIRRIGLVTLITNCTTAVGFFVLSFADISILQEFGIVAGVNIFATFFVSIILIPSVFSWLPPPNNRQLKHLQFKPLEKALTGLDLLVHRYKFRVFLITAVLVGVSIVGIFKMNLVSYMVDDIPEESQVMKDLRFFEKNFVGVMPLEVVVDTGKRQGVLKLNNLRKIEQFENFLSEQSAISNPISIISFIKTVRQSFYNNNPAFYSLPNNQDKAIFARHLSQLKESNSFSNSFVDSTGQTMRISLKIADIGSNKMDSLINHVIKPAERKIFANTSIKAQVTGATPLFIKGNKFLVKNLRNSLLIAFGIIALIMAVLFQNIRMILISLIPNLIPLVITAGIMGYFSIPLKPSTALIFSIAFGISVDDSIHFLAKYRQELYLNNFFVPIAVSKSIRETGASMMYTSIVLFAGFVIFAGSEFGGTIALGMLTSITLLIAMFTNLIVLPSLLLTFDNGKRKKGSKPLIEHYEFYQEDEDEEIDLDLIEVTSNSDSIKENQITVE